MQTIKLNAQVREIVGKKVKKLRRKGLVPAGVYGKGIKSESLAVPLAEFLKVYAKAGETGLVELAFGGKSQHTLIGNVQRDPLTKTPLHVEFHAVKLTEKIKANVPVELVGESPAVADKTGLLLQTVSEVEVEALPTDLPDKLTVDVTKLTAVDQQVTVGELTVPAGVEILTSKEEIVVRVAPAVSEEMKKEMEAEAAAKAAEVPTEGEALKEEVPAEGEKASEAPEEKRE